ncbi:MAG: hypothetical protein PHX34_01860 [Candidatus Shapirobacteria bacterium]|nr:hypothetical protein [Candidatus Shapirobacteria bacterium]
MFKELFLAIILGALLGFGITGGYLAIDKKNNQNKIQPVITSPTPIPSIIDSQNQTEKKDDGLTLNSIEDLDIVSQEDLELTGVTTSPESTIIVTLGNQILSSKSDKDGKFNLQLKLDSGLNIIKITVIDSNNNQFEKTLNITYSTAKI